MRMALFNCHHAVPDQPLTQGMFATLVSGVASATDGRYVGDLSGLNIAGQNEHSEMRHQYFVWKNLLGKYDHVGFEHYSRLFFLDPLSDTDLRGQYPELHKVRAGCMRDQLRPRYDLSTADYLSYFAMRRGFEAETTARLQQWITRCDVIVQRPLLTMPVDEQWKSTHMAPLWDLLKSAIVRNSYFSRRKLQIDFSMNCGSYCNMYMMRAELFDEYMRFWEESIGLVRAEVEVYPRLLGHFSERFFAYFLMQKRMEQPLLHIVALPHLYRNVNLD